MDVSQSQFLELNRAALWRKVADVSLFEREVGGNAFSKLQENRPPWVSPIPE